MATTLYPAPVGGVPPANGTIYKCVFFINGPNCGWSETYYVAPGVSDPTKIPAAMEKVASAYAAARILAMVGPFSVQAMRYSDVTIPGNSSLLVPITFPRFGALVGLGVPANTNPFPALGVQVRLSDALNVVRRNEIYRGIPQAWLTSFPTTASASIKWSAPTYTAWRKAMNGWYQNVQTGDPTTGGGAACLRYVVKNPALNPPSAITSIGSTNGMLTVYVASIPPILAGLPGGGVGASLKVAGVRIKCARKLNGIATIINVLPVTAQQPFPGYVLCKTFCCGGQPIICPRNGTVSAVLYGYTAIINTGGEQSGTRKTGRPFRLRPGRRLNCC